MLSVLSMTTEYFTTEPFMDWVFSLPSFTPSLYSARCTDIVLLFFILFFCLASVVCRNQMLEFKKLGIITVLSSARGCQIKVTSYHFILSYLCNLITLPFSSLSFFTMNQSFFLLFTSSFVEGKQCEWYN